MVCPQCKRQQDTGRFCAEDGTALVEALSGPKQVEVRLDTPLSKDKLKQQLSASGLSAAEVEAVRCLLVAVKLTLEVEGPNARILEASGYGQGSGR